MCTRATKNTQLGPARVGSVVPQPQVSAHSPCIPRHRKKGGELNSLSTRRRRGNHCTPRQPAAPARQGHAGGCTGQTDSFTPTCYAPRARLALHVSQACWDTRRRVLNPQEKEQACDNGLQGPCKKSKTALLPPVTNVGGGGDGGGRQTCPAAGAWRVVLTGATEKAIAPQAHKSCHRLRSFVLSVRTNDTTRERSAHNVWGAAASQH